MKRTEMGFSFFLEIYEYFPKPFEPGTGDLHDPATRLVIGMGHLFALLFAPGPDAGDIPLFDRDPAALPVDNIAVVPVPESGTIFPMGPGVAGLVAWRKKFRK